MNYKITYKNQFKVLQFLLLGSVFFIGLLYFLYHSLGVDNFFFNLPVLDSILFNFIHSALFLHVEYYLINKNDVIEISSTQRKIIFTLQKEILFDEIDSISLIMSPVAYRKGIIRITPFDDYSYAIIKTKKNEQFIFTCLMSYKLEETINKIDNVPVNRLRRFLPTTLIR